MEQLSKEYFDQWMNRITEHQEQMMGELRQLKDSRLTLMGTA